VIEVREYFQTHPVPLEQFKALLAGIGLGNYTFAQLTEHFRAVGLPFGADAATTAATAAGGGVPAHQAAAVAAAVAAAPAGAASDFVRSLLQVPVNSTHAHPHAPISIPRTLGCMHTSTSKPSDQCAMPPSLSLSLCTCVYVCY
jgi:hypothetical protein